jgi:SAM-dependent methyltransferase
MSEDQLRRYWTRVGNEILQRRPDGWAIAGDDTPFQRYKAGGCRALVEAVPVAKGSILEVGCGPGGNLTAMVDQGPRKLVGCDISPSMIAVAQRNTSKRVPLVQIDGHRMPFATGSFDVTFTVTVLQHIDDPHLLDDLVSEMARVTRTWVFLFEDTSRKAKIQPGYARRPVEFYAHRLGPLGFRLEGQTMLRVMVSETASRLTRRVLPHMHEGARVSHLVRLSERLAMLVTRPLDRVVQANNGLCRMTFRRSAG